MKQDLILINSNYDVEINLRYATKNNVTGIVFYDNDQCYLHKDAAIFLEKAVELAKIQGYKIRIFDGFRPLKAQEFLFSKFSAGGFVSNPKTGAIPHCRAIALDLTLIDIASGKELEMGTDFDDFSKLAHHGNVEVSADAQKNRYILMGIMMSSGFDFYEKEWWHYQLFNPRSYDILS